MPLAAAQDPRETPFVQRSVENSQIAFSLKRPVRGSWATGRLGVREAYASSPTARDSACAVGGAGSVPFIQHAGRGLG